MFPVLATRFWKTPAHSLTAHLLSDRKLLERVDKMLAEDIAKLMAMVPLEEAQTKSEGTDRSGNILPPLNSV